MENTTPVLEQNAQPLSETKYFGVSTPRFALYLLVSSGLWTIYWFYRNWQAINKAGYRKQFRAFWRALFYMYTTHSLTGKILRGAKEKGYPKTYDSKSMGIALIVLGLFSSAMSRSSDRLVEISGDAGKLISSIILFAVIVGMSMLPALILQPVNEAIDYLKQQQGRQKGDDDVLTTGQIMIFVAGILLWLIALLAMMAPRA